MSKTRLNNHSRDVLNRLAERLVQVSDDELRASQKDGDTLVRKMVEHRYPPKDMKVLRQYEQAHEDRCIRVRLHAGGDFQWNIRKDSPSVWQPGRYSCSNMHLADESTTAAIELFRKLEADFKKRRAEKLAPYYKLINSSSTFEAVVSVWAEAEQVRAECGARSSAVVGAVTPEIIDAIHADMAERVAA